MVREFELRAWMRVWPRAAASAWSRLEQVHLVRFDLKWRRLSLQPDAPAREVKDMNAFTCTGPYAMLILSFVAMDEKYREEG